MGGITPNCELVRETAESLHMETIENNTVKLVSHFQRGGWVSQWDGQKFVKIASAAENTLHDDGDDSKEVVLPEGFKGAVGEFHGVSSLSYQSSVTLVGFTGEELDAPSPVQGWNNVGVGFRAERCELIKSFGDYLKALANNSFVAIPEKGETHPVSGNRLVELPFDWGDQAANHYAIISPKGEILSEVSGCGDQAPYPLKADGTKDWELSSSFEDANREQHERNERNNAAFKLGWSDEWADVAHHLRSSYRISQNPLKGLRKKFPGTWKYIAEGNLQEDSQVGEVRFTALPQKENETATAPDGYSSFWGNVWGRWQVSYIPNK